MVKHRPDFRLFRLNRIRRRPCTMRYLPIKTMRRTRRRVFERPIGCVFNDNRYTIIVLGTAGMSSRSVKSSSGAMLTSSACILGLCFNGALAATCAAMERLPHNAPPRLARRRVQPMGPCQRFLPPSQRGSRPGLQRYRMPLRLRRRTLQSMRHGKRSRELTLGVSALQSSRRTLRPLHP